MTSVMMSHPAQTTRNPPTSDAEPDEAWKLGLRKQIEESLLPMVQEAKDALQRKLNEAPVDQHTRDRLASEHSDTLKNIRRIADDLYRDQMTEERAQLRMAQGGPVDQALSVGIVKQQQAILEQIEREKQRRAQLQQSRPVSTNGNGSYASSPTYAPSPTHQARQQSQWSAAESPSDREPEYFNRPTSDRNSIPVSPGRPFEDRATGRPRGTSGGNIFELRYGGERPNGEYSRSFVDEPEEIERPDRFPGDRPEGRGSLRRQNSSASQRPTLPEIWKPSISPEEDAALSRTSQLARRGSVASIQSGSYRSPSVSSPGPNSYRPPSVTQTPDRPEHSPVARKHSNASITSHSYRPPSTQHISDRPDLRSSTSDVVPRPERERTHTQPTEEEWDELTKPLERPRVPGRFRADSGTRRSGDYPNVGTSNTESPVAGPSSTPAVHPPSTSRPIEIPRGSRPSSGISASRPSSIDDRYATDDAQRVQPLPSSLAHGSWAGPQRGQSKTRSDSVISRSPAAIPEGSASQWQHRQGQPQTPSHEHGAYHHAPVIARQTSNQAAQTSDISEDSDSEEESRRDEYDRQTRQMEEEAKKREEDAKRREAEAKRREEEAIRKEEEFRRKEEESRRKEEEVLRKEEEARQKEDQARRKEEEARKVAEELRKKEVETKKKEAALKKKEEKARRREEEMRRKEEETARKEEEAKRKEEEAERKEEELRQMEVEATRKREEAEQREEEARQRAEEVERLEREALAKEVAARQLEEETRKKEEEIAKREELLKKREEELERRELEAQRREEEKRRLREEETRKREEEERQRVEDALAAEAEEERLRELRAEEERKQKLEARKQAEELRLRNQEIRRKEAEKRQAEVAQRERDLERREEEAKQREEERAKRERQEAVARRAEEERVKRVRDEEAAKRTRETASRRKEEERVGRQRDEAAKRRDEERARRDREEEADAIRQVEEMERREAEASDRERTQQEQFRKREEEIRRRAYERRSLEDYDFVESRSPAPKVSASPPASSPWPIPNSRSATGTPSQADRNSGATGSSWASSSSRPSFTGTPPSTARTSTASATAKPIPTAARPTTYSNTNSGTSPMHSIPSEEEWARRQEEQAQRQQDAFRREQEQQEIKRQTQMGKIMSKDDVLQVFKMHEGQWSSLPTLRELGWHSFPWPVWRRPREPEDLTSTHVGAYVLSQYYPGGENKSAKDRIKENIRKWHPDRFETKYLPKVVLEEREKVKVAAGVVARVLNEMLTRSNVHDVFS